MKRLCLFAAVALLAFFTAFPVFAADLGNLSKADMPEYDFQSELDAVGADDLFSTLPNDAQNLMEGAGIDAIDYKQLLSLEPKEFFREVWGMVLQRLRQPMVTFGALLGTVLLCALLDGLKTVMGENTLSGVFSAVSVVCTAGAIVTPIIGCIGATSRAITDCANFLTAFIPVFSSVVMVSGQPLTAGGYAAFLFLACQVVSQIAASTLVPLMGIYLAFCIAGNLVPGVNITAVAHVIKQTVSWALGLLVTLFVALLSVQTLVASSGDAVMSKTAKFLIGTFIPVVGSALSDAFVASQGYLKLLKTTVGAFGILVALMTFLPILLQTAIWYVTVNVSAAVGELLDVKQITGILKSAGTTLGILLAIIFCFALLVIICTTLVLICATGI